MDFAKELLKNHFGAVAALVIFGLALSTGLLVWLSRLAKADRKAAKRELYLLVTLKRIFFSKDSPNAIMEDLAKTDTPLDETALPFKAVSDPRKEKS